MLIAMPILVSNPCNNCSPDTPSLYITLALLLGVVLILVFWNSPPVTRFRRSPPMVRFERWLEEQLRRYRL